MEADKEGTVFDPALHYVKDGKGVLTKAGVWRRKGGAKEKAPDTLQAQLDVLRAQIAQRDAEIEALKKTDPKLEAERLRAVAELQNLKPAAPAVTPGSPPQLIPYKGAVKALADCHYGGYQKVGDVFHVDVPALWSDDPYVPVIVTGYNENGSMKTEPNPLAPPQIDFVTRPRTADAFARLSATTRTAKDF